MNELKSKTPFLWRLLPFLQDSSVLSFCSMIPSPNLVLCFHISKNCHRCHFTQDYAWKRQRERIAKLNEPHFKQSLHLYLTAADPVDVVAVIINVVFAICIRWWKTRRIDVGSFACLFPFLMKTSWNQGSADVNVDVQTIIVAAAAEFPLSCLPLFSYVYGTTKSVTLKRTPNPNTRETTQCPGAWQNDINFSLFRIR